MIIIIMIIIIICPLSPGVDYTHPDLSTNYVRDKRHNKYMYTITVYLE